MDSAKKLTTSKMIQDVFNLMAKITDFHFDRVNSKSIARMMQDQLDYSYLAGVADVLTKNDDMIESKITAIKDRIDG